MIQAKAIMFTSPGVAEFLDSEVPETPEANFVLLKTEVTVISPGTEFACLTGKTNRKGPNFPACLGYSAVAKVLAVGPEVKELQPGDRCLCYHSCHRNYQYMPETNLVKIEDDALPAEEAVFCVIGTMGYQGISRCRPAFGECAVIMGLGLLGQFAVQTAHLSGCFPVIALDFNEERRKLALSTGADAAFAPDEPELNDKIQKLNYGKKADILIEVTGNPQALEQGLRLCAKFARAALVGCSRTATENFDFYNLVHLPGITLYGASNTARPPQDGRPGLRTEREDMRVLLRAMAVGRLKSRHLITGIADPAEAPAIYARLLQRDPAIFGQLFDWRKY